MPKMLHWASYWILTLIMIVVVDWIVLTYLGSEKRERMDDGGIMRKTGQTAFTILFIYLIATVSAAAFTVRIDSDQSFWERRDISGAIPWTSSAMAAAEPENSDLKWFRDKMKISPEYTERHEGVLGMSWAHFLTMVFLALFATGAFIVFYMRHKRTREIIKLLKEEMTDGKNN